MYNDSSDSVSSTCSDFNLHSVPVYASTPQSSASFSDDSFVGNISPISPEVCIVSSDENSENGENGENGENDKNSG